MDSQLKNKGKIVINVGTNWTHLINARICLNDLDSKKISPRTCAEMGNQQDCWLDPSAQQIQSLISALHLFFKSLEDGLRARWLTMRNFEGLKIPQLPQFPFSSCNEVGAKSSSRILALLVHINFGISVKNS